MTNFLNSSNVKTVYDALLDALSAIKGYKVGWSWLDNPLHDADIYHMFILWKIEELNDFLNSVRPASAAYDRKDFDSEEAYNMFLKAMHIDDSEKPSMSKDEALKLLTENILFGTPIEYENEQGHARVIHRFQVPYVKPIYPSPINVQNFVFIEGKAQKAAKDIVYSNVLVKYEKEVPYEDIDIMARLLFNRALQSVEGMLNDKKIQAEYFDDVVYKTVCGAASDIGGVLDSVKDDQEFPIFGQSNPLHDALLKLAKR